MDKKALYQLSYGVFIVTTKTDDKENGCITNTCIQVANSPVRVAIAVLNTNYTCELIKESGVFAVTLLDRTATFETISHWGFSSGRDTDKLEGLELPRDVNGVCYIPWQSASFISCRVVDRQDLGSHTLFIGEVVDAGLLSGNAPLTYADYLDHVKPKPAEPAKEKKIIGWRCRICGYVYEGAELPADYTCPLCGHPREDFEPIYES